MCVVLHWGHSRSPKVLILSFVWRQRLSGLAGWPWYGADNYSLPCRPDEPHRKSPGNLCQCPLHRHREKNDACWKDSFCFLNTFSPFEVPQSVPVTENWSQSSQKETSMPLPPPPKYAQKGAIFICELTRKTECYLAHGMYTCAFLFEEAREDSLFSVVTYQRRNFSVCGHLNMFWFCLCVFSLLQKP